MLWYWAISNTTIDPASDGATSPGTGTVELLKTTYGAAGTELERSGETETAYNRAENITIVQDTLLMCTRFRGELIVMWADCSAMGSPPV